MTQRHLIDEKAIEKIKEHGCCLGKYRVLFSDGYYCFLENIFNCAHQDRRYVKIINGHMLVCKSNKQLPCEECEIYLKAKSKTTAARHK